MFYGLQVPLQTFKLFSGYSFWSIGGGPEKDLNVCVSRGGGLHSLSLDLSGQPDILWHDGDSPGVDGTQVGVFKETHKIGLCCFLKTHYGC